MTTRYRGLGLRLVSVLLSAGAIAHAAGPLDEACPMDWRGTPFSQAVRELAGRLDLAYALDESVGPEAADAPVRFQTEHLTGREAVRWLARSVGLEAVVVGETVYIASPQRLPRTWAGGVLDPDQDETGRSRWRLACTRRADITWVDAPLSLVARDIARAYGIDLVLPRGILAEQDLVHIERLQVTLEALCEALGAALGTPLGYWDGVVTTVEHQGPSTRAAATQAAPGPPGPVPAGGRSLLGSPLVIDQPPPDWTAFRSQVGAATGLDCRLEGATSGPVPLAQARGTVLEVLDGARMLGILDFQILTPDAQKAPLLLIQVH